MSKKSKYKNTANKFIELPPPHLNSSEENLKYNPKLFFKIYPLYFSKQNLKNNFKIQQNNNSHTEKNIQTLCDVIENMYNAEKINFYWLFGFEMASKLVPIISRMENKFSQTIKTIHCFPESCSILTGFNHYVKSTIYCCRKNIKWEWKCICDSNSKIKSLCNKYPKNILDIEDSEITKKNWITCNNFLIDVSLSTIFITNTSLLSILMGYKNKSDILVIKMGNMPDSDIVLLMQIMYKKIYLWNYGDKYYLINITPINLEDGEPNKLILRKLFIFSTKNCLNVSKKNWTFKNKDYINFINEIFQNIIKKNLENQFYNLEKWLNKYEDNILELKPSNYLR